MAENLPQLEPGERSTEGAGATPPEGPPPPPPPGPIAQSVAIGFRTVYIAAALLGLLWLTSNVREIASDTQAVVLRFGRIVRTQEAGLLIAWPRPIEDVQLLPGPERQLSQNIATLPPQTEKSAALVGPFVALGLQLLAHLGLQHLLDHGGHPARHRRLVGKQL